jgi:PAS domain S-box-containing protein
MRIVDTKNSGAIASRQEPGLSSEIHELVRDLQAREAELALIHRIAGVGGVEVDLRGGFRNRRSPEYLMIHGLPATAANETHEEWVARIHPEDRRRTETQFLEAIAGDATDYSAEYRIIRPSDGQMRWIRVAAKIERDSIGQALRLIGAHFDITESMLAQQALRESEQRFRLIANNAPIPMWVTKLDGERSFVNQAYLDFFDLSYEEALAFDWRKRVHPDDASRLLNPEQLSNVVQAPPDRAANPFALEIRLLRADGEWRWIKAVSQPRFDEGGRHVGFIGVGHDITIAKQAEIELRQVNELLEHRIKERTRQLAAREAQMRTILETSNQYQCLVAPDGRVQYANRTALASIHKQAVEVLSELLWEAAWFSETPQAPDVVRAMLATASNGEAAQTELTLQLPIGLRVLEIGMRPIMDQSGVVSSILVEAVDITERRRNEEVLRQSQKMEAVGQLTGGVAHDFNNLLTIISSATEFLQSPDLPHDRRQRYVGVISNTVGRATKLTSQLLAFARRHPMKPERFDVCKQVETIAQLLQPVLTNRIRIDLDLKNRDCTAVADLPQFETAVINLALNARDAIPDTGTLTLRVTKASEIPSVRGQPPRSGNFTAVSVVDTGVGIEPELLEKIFEPFFTTKQVGKGTGLGLSQAFGFSKQSGGEIEVISEPGKGSTFVIYLPIAEAAQEPLPADRNSHRSDAVQQRYRVLVVEDNEEIGKLVAEQLQALGHQVWWVKSAETALDLLADGRLVLDLLCSDVVMPGMNGIDLARIVRESYPKLRVVLTSGYSDALAEGAKDEFILVRKPYSIHALVNAFHNTFRVMRSEPAI